MIILGFHLPVSSWVSLQFSPFFMTVLEQLLLLNSVPIQEAAHFYESLQCPGVLLPPPFFSVSYSPGFSKSHTQFVNKLQVKTHLKTVYSRKADDPWLPSFQEKMKGKNKLVPRLLGITKDSVMRVDEKTKEVLQEWPLTTVKRWAASPKSFTLVGRARPRGD